MRKDQWRLHRVDITQPADQLGMDVEMFAVGSPLSPSPPPSRCLEVIHDEYSSWPNPSWSTATPTLWLFSYTLCLSYHLPGTLKHDLLIVREHREHHDVQFMRHTHWSCCTRRQWHGTESGCGCDQRGWVSFCKVMILGQCLGGGEGGMERLTISTSNIVSSWVISHGFSIAPSSSKSIREGTST